MISLRFHSFDHSEVISTETNPGRSIFLFIYRRNVFLRMTSMRSIAYGLFVPFLIEKMLQISRYHRLTPGDFLLSLNK